MGSARLILLVAFYLPENKKKMNDLQLFILIHINQIAPPLENSWSFSLIEREKSQISTTLIKMLIINRQIKLLPSSTQAMIYYWLGKRELWTLFFDLKKVM